MTELHVGPREIVAVLLAVVIILDVAAWRARRPRPPPQD